MLSSTVAALNRIISFHRTSWSSRHQCVLNSCRDLPLTNLSIIVVFTTLMCSQQLPRSTPNLSIIVVFTTPTFLDSCLGQPITNVSPSFVVFTTPTFLHRKCLCIAHRGVQGKTHFSLPTMSMLAPVVRGQWAASFPLLRGDERGDEPSECFFERCAFRSSSCGKEESGSS